MRSKLILILGLFIIATCANAQDTIVIESVFDDVLLVLNDGEKWKVNEQIEKLMGESIELVNDKFSESNVKGKKLAKKLISLKDKIIENCDMQGKAHIIFHRWLVIYIDLLDNLKQSKSIDAQQMFLREFKRASKEYHTYFE